MKAYKRMVALCCTLALVLAMSELCAYIIDCNSELYYDVVTPLPLQNSLVWLFVYVLIALVFAETLAQPNLRENAVYCAFLLIVNTLWFVSLFIFKALSTATSVLLLQNVLCQKLIFAYRRTSKVSAAVISIVALWYAYLFFASYAYALRL